MMTSTDILERGLNLLRDWIRDSMQAAGVWASGRTWEALEVRVPSPTSGQLWGPGHITLLPNGRGPGPTPREFQDIIAAWALDKGLTFTTFEELERFANAVAWSIYYYGTKQYRSGGTLDLFESNIERFERWLLEQFGTLYLTRLKDALTWQR